MDGDLDQEKHAKQSGCRTVCHWFHDHGQRCDIDGDGDAADECDFIINSMEFYLMP